MTDRRLNRILGTFLAALALAACGSDDGTGPDLQDIDFVDELQVDLSAMTLTASGLYFQDLTVGDGAVAEVGSTAVLDYAGWLPNGANFDNGTAFTFTVGLGDVIAGFDEGVEGMRVGGTRLIVIPPGLAYGNQVVGGIPSNSTLVFRMTLTGVQ